MSSSFRKTSSSSSGGGGLSGQDCVVQCLLKTSHGLPLVRIWGRIWGGGVVLVFRSLPKAINSYRSTTTTTTTTPTITRRDPSFPWCKISAQSNTRDYYYDDDIVASRMDM